MTTPADNVEALTERRRMQDREHPLTCVCRRCIAEDWDPAEEARS